MAEIGYFFTSAAGDRKYTAADFADLFNQLARRQSGVIRGLGNALVASNAGTLSVDVNTGVAQKAGYLYQNTASLNLALEAVTSGSKRIDRVVVRVDLTARQVTATIIKGTESGTPVAPAIDGATDVAIAQVLIDRSSGTYAYTVTDERTYSDAYLAPATIKKFNENTFSLDDLVDGVSFTRVTADAIGTGNKIDFSKTGFLNKTLTNIADDATYAKTTVAGATAANAVGAASGATTGAKLVTLIDGTDRQVPTDAGAGAANDIGAATGATTALKVANLASASTESQQGVVKLASTTPAALGTASKGTGTTAAKADHVHQMPTAADVGAASTSHNHDSTYAPIAKGVTNGDSHDHSGGDGAQIAYSGLSGLPTLGDSASKNVGTTSGTVCAGDDSRLAQATTSNRGTAAFASTGTQDATKMPKATGAELAALLTAGGYSIAPATGNASLDNIADGTTYKRVLAARADEINAATNGLPKRTKMPDGATAVYSQDDFASAVGTAYNCTLSVAGGIQRATFTSGGSFGWFNANTPDTKGKIVVARIRASRSMGIKAWNGNDNGSSATIGVDWSVYSFLNKVAFGGYGFEVQAPAAGDWFEIEWMWIGSLSYLTGTLSEEAARIADQLGDSAGVGVAASGTITSNTGLPTAGKKVTIGGKAYTFVDAISGTRVEGEVKIRSTYALAMTDLYVAINRENPASYDYDGSSPLYNVAAAHPLVYATNPSSGVVNIYSKTTGELQNSITLSTDETTLTLSGTSLSGGYSDAAAKITALARGATAGTPTAGYFPKFSTVGGSVGIPTQNISFPATQAASTDPNALDDYEEGTWTPTLEGAGTAGSATYSTQVGTYTKIGRKVFGTFSIVLTGKGGMVGNVKMVGLPFAALSTTGVLPSIMFSQFGNITFPSGKTQLSGNVINGNSYATFNGMGSAATTAILTDSNFADNTNIYGSFEYIV